MCRSVKVLARMWAYDCAGELYAKFAILNESRTTNEVMFKGFCGGRRKNCPVSLSVVP